MSLPNLHSPAQILAAVLVARGLGTDPADGDAWPVHHGGEPDRPDNCITVRTTAGVDQGRLMPTGEVVQYPGIQVRVRATTEAVGFPKAAAIAHALDEDVYDDAVTLGAATYLVHCFSRTGNVLPLGKETPSSKRSLLTINGLVTIKRVS